MARNEVDSSYACEEETAVKPETKHKTHWFTYATIFTVNILGFSYGLLNAWSSPMVIKLLSGATPLGRPVTADEVSWIVSLASIGSIIGPVPLGFVCNYFGRKPVLAIIGALMVLSSILLACGQAIWLYYLARVLGGIANGGVLSLAGMYMLEICHMKEKGLASAASYAVVMLGMLLGNCIGPYVSYVAYNMVCGVVPAVFLVVLIVFMVETPGFLMMKGRKEEALANLTRFRLSTKEEIKEELDAMVSHLEEQTNTGSFIEVLKDKILLKCFFIGLLLVTAQHLSGNIPIGAYTQLIFEEAGGNLSSDISTIITTSVQVVLTFPAPMVLRKFRYRLLLPLSSGGMGFSLFFLGLFFHLKNNTDVDTSSIGWLPITSMIFSLFCFVYGLAVIPTIMLVEMFPTKLRALTITVIYMISSAQTFVITKWFLKLADSIGYEWCFWIFAICCGVSVVLFLVFVPETNGKNYQEIQEMMKKK